jgi:hypothetical protein
MAAGTPDKVAIVVIHGMGEQRPMETLRGFAETLWERDPSLFTGLSTPADHANSETWSKPDRVSGSAELRRITTARARDPKAASGTRGIRADFFELHWADLTADSTWGDFVLWFWRLLARNPFDCGVPVRVLLVWCLLWIITLCIVLSALATAIMAFPPLKDTPITDFLGGGGWAWLTAALGLVGAGLKELLTSYFGDVARYVTASPRNIKVRQAARDRGLKLIKELHATEEYLRIVIVGHSLGSVLAHDLVALAWAEQSTLIQVGQADPIRQAIAACEAAGIVLLATRDAEPLPARSVGRHDTGCKCNVKAQEPTLAYVDALRAYRVAQRSLFELLSKVNVGKPGEEKPAWLISDLVTLGSPLTHSSFLLARNGCELQAMTRSREILRSPPVYEAKAGSTTPVFTFPVKGTDNLRMHHATALAPVRWTNLHDVTDPVLFLQGDLISGPLSTDYGPGVADINVRPTRQGVLSRFFTHTLYWTYALDHAGPAPDHVAVLRDAVNVLDDPAAEQRLLKRLTDDLYAQHARRAA